MKTLFTESPDGLKIAYDCSGSGEALVLIHGGGSSRQEWHQAGYVKRLREHFKVVTLDLRGHGESAKPTDPAAYSPEKQGKDILAVADACGAERFILWGMSYGARVCRYLGVKSRRVTKLILLGVPLGPGISSELRAEVERFSDHWPPILKALKNGALEPEDISAEDREFMAEHNVPVVMAWGGAMLDYPRIEPGDFICPTLWVVGSEDQPAMDSAREYHDRLPGTRVKLFIAEGLDHDQVFEEISRVYPVLLGFLRS